MENMILISNKFLDQINALLIMAEKEVIRIPTVKKEISLNDLFETILSYKTIQLKSTKVESEEDFILDEHQTEFMMKIEEMITESKMVSHIVNNVNLVITDEAMKINTTSALTSSLSQNYSKRSRYRNTENELYKNSLIMSLATAFELLVADLIKDYALSNKNPNFFNDYKIDFKTLVQIGNVETAKDYLVDRYIEDVLRSNVTEWIAELGKISDKIHFNELTEHNILLIETFQRRHLLVHNNGVVNNLYLSKVDSSLTKDIVKDAQLESSKEYIINRINTFREIGLVLLYKYFSTIYRDQKEDVYNTLEGHILERIPNNCLATETIYRIVMNDQKYPSSIKVIAKINYWLSKKFNGKFNEVIGEVKQFDVYTLQPRFQMAKNLLLDNKKEGFENFLAYTSSMNSNQLFFIFEWPLLTLLNDYDDFIDYKKTIMDSLIEEMERV